MKINFIETKNVITKSNIPDIDYVINPYIGCQHGCIYCYAEYMKRFTNHSGEKWGEFLDIKQVNLETIKPEKYNGKTILISSVTDPYIPLEMKYKNTRRILEQLIGTTAKISILTKSRFVVRDIDLFKRLDNVHVGISINTLDTELAKEIEPLASKLVDRIRSIEEIKKNNIITYVFISPIFPEITDYKEIISETREFTDYYLFENLNFRSHNISRILKLIENHFPEKLDFYEKLRKNSTYWDYLKLEIKKYCKIHNIDFRIEFHHGGFSKKEKEKERVF